MSRTSRLCFVALLALAGACARGGSAAPTSPAAHAYADAKLWLCRPDRAGDACQRDLSATEERPDGTRAAAPFTAATSPKVDCFYVYPTVDLELMPGNHTDFDDLGPMADTTVAQAARFRESCALYVPLYRQVTLGTYLRPPRRLEQGLALAFSDVEQAFAEYMEHDNHGRPVVLIGHSQGAEMVVRLLKRFFDGDPAMQKKLLLALAIGGNVEVPRGKTVGGTFATLPVCTQEGQTACVIAYRSYAAGEPVTPDRYAPKPGNETVCVNPADVGGHGVQRFSRAYLPTASRLRRRLPGTEGMSTPFLLLRDFYAGQCVDGPDGFRYLAVSVPEGDARKNPIDFSRVLLHEKLGLHVLDLQLAQGDLVDQVERRAAALP